MPHKIYLALLLFFATGCKEKFTVPLTSSEVSLLVVEGNLDCTPGATTSIRLTRTYKLENSASIVPVANAQIFVDGKDNSSRLLRYAGGGNYTGQLAFMYDQEYRLRILTTDGKQYLSDYVTAKKNPPIDSINYKNDNGGVKLFVNTHDDENKSKYYRWEYQETWEINSTYYSLYKYVDGKVLPRAANENVNKCWKTQASSKILLGSTTQLQSDVIYQYPLLSTEPNSEKFSVRYSILVKQFVLSKEGFDYLQLMRKNSETLGSVFDAQPSELRGNIHCITHPEEQVIGFLTASAVSEKRIFITSYDVPWTKFRLTCYDKEIANHPDSIKAEMPTYLPVDAIYGNSATTPRAWFSATGICVDCTLRGGNLNRPSFW